MTAVNTAPLVPILIPYDPRLMTSLTPGMRLHDRLVLVERIGSGGMAQVWRADDLILGRPVAVRRRPSAATRPGGWPPATRRRPRPG